MIEKRALASLAWKAALPALFCAACRPSSPPPAGDTRGPAYFCEDTERPFFTPGPDGTFDTSRPQAIPQSFSMPKPAGVRRVFILGESVATLLEHGQALAPGEDPAPLLKTEGTAPWRGGGRGKAAVEIFNCGMGGYESRRIGAVLREALNYSPDLLVVLSGNNEGGPEQLCPGLRNGLRRRALRLSQLYYTLLYGAGEGAEKAALEKHRRELASMARAAKKAGVPVVFCTLPANLRDMPERSALPEGNGPLARGYELFYSGDYAGALGQFKAGLAASPADHFINFYAAKALDRLGRKEEAAARYLAALGYAYADPARTTPARNALIRKTASEEGACLADLDGLFRRLAGGDMPGFGQFTDGVHWRPAYNKAVWDEIFRSAAGCGISGFSGITVAGRPRWNESAREDLRKRLSYAFSWLPEGRFDQAVLAELEYIDTKDNSLLTAAAASPEALSKLLLENSWSGGPAAETGGRFPYFLAHLAELHRRNGRRSEALSFCDRAIALAPAARHLQAERALILSGAPGRKPGGR